MKVHRLPRLGQPSPAQTRDDEVVKIAALSWLPAWAGLGWAGLAGLGWAGLGWAAVIWTSQSCSSRCPVVVAVAR